MKTAIKLSIITALFLLVNILQAQPLNGLYTVGKTGNYTTLTAALADIKTKGRDSQLTLELQKDYALSGETFPIVIDTSMSNEMYPLTISLAIDAINITIGSSAASIFRFEGASWVTINGTSTGMTEDLTLMNTATATIGAAIEFANGASNNLIQYCQLQSSSSVTNSATVLFSASTNGKGNINNKIQNCKLNNAMGKPYAAVLSKGATGAENSGNIIQNCELVDFNNCGINLQANSGNDWDIYYNSFYATQSSTAQTGAITITSPTSNNIKIHSNYIGGSTSYCGGYAWNETAANIAMMYLTVDTKSPSFIDGNTISNINFSNTSTSTAMLINITAGSVNIGEQEANWFGSMDSTNIFFAGNGTFNVINGNANSIQNNIISGIAVTAASVSNRFIAINSSAPIIENNTIKHLQYFGMATPPSPSLCAIASTSTAAKTSIQKNTIYDLQLKKMDLTAMDAININSTSSNILIQDNTIYGLVPGGMNNVVRGIFIQKGKCDVVNNMISLGLDNMNNPIDISCNIMGINKQSTEDANIFHNSIRIQGTCTIAGNTNTTCFVGGPVTTTTFIKNNIFSNTRTYSTGTYKNACVDLKYGSPYYSVNYNNYDTLGTNAIFGFVNTAPYTSFASWQTATGGEVNGYHQNPGFYSETDLHINDGYFLNGDKTVPVYVDFDGNPRIKSQVGADEYLVPQVDAAFSYFIDTANLKVTFTDTTAGLFNSWMWDFGDETSSTQQNPVHTYKNSGGYYVKLSVYNDTSGVGGSASYYIQVGEVNCYAYFSLATSPGNTVTTTNNSGHADGDTLKYLWNFGDEAISNQLEPTYKFNQQGMYNVTLTVVNDKKTCVQSYSEQIKVGTGNCNSFFTYQVDTATNSVTCIPENNDLTAMYYWEFGDGSYSMEKKSSYDYPNPGYFQISLMVYDTVNQCGQSWSDVVMMYSKGNDCQAGFSYFQDTVPNVLMFMDYSATLNEHTVVWDFGTGDTSHLTNPVYGYTKGGYYTVCLSITDNVTKCKNTYCNVIPVGMEYFGVPNMCKAAYKSIVDTTTNTVTFFDMSIGDRNKYYWDFGDGNTSDEKAPKHTYTDKGYYSVYLWIQDSITGFGSDYFDVLNVGNGDNGLVPDFFYKTDTTLLAKGVLPVEFKGASYGDASEVEWDFGDGSTNSSTTAPTHEYNTDGDFKVCYTVEDPIVGDSATVCQIIKIAVTSINKVQVTSDANGFTMYPNPASQSLTVVVSTPLNYQNNAVTSSSAAYRDASELQITNTLGQIVFHQHINTPVLSKVEVLTKQHIDISQFQSGLYFVRIGNTTKKLIINK